MSDRSLCRIGVFYDGSYFAKAQEYFWHNRKLGWLEFRPFQTFLESYIQRLELGYTQHRIVYAAWFQGLFAANQAEERQLKRDRILHHDLMHAGIEPQYIPMPQAGKQEKGVDVALAIDAVQVGLEGKIDIAVLVTGDGDFVPLAHTLMKYGIRVMAAYFQYQQGDYKGSINEHLITVCDYCLNINDLEKDKDFKVTFKRWFRKPNEGKNRAVAS